MRYSDIDAARGKTFFSLVNQFCQKFTDMSHIMDYTSFIVTQVANHMKPSHISKKLENYIKRSELTTEGAALLQRFVDSTKQDFPKIILFPVPKEEGRYELSSDLLNAINNSADFITGVMSNISISKEAKELISPLFDNSFQNLQELFTTLKTVSTDPTKYTSADQQDNDFVSVGSRIKRFLPKNHKAN